MGRIVRSFIIETRHVENNKISPDISGFLGVARRTELLKASTELVSGSTPGGPSKGLGGMTRGM